MTVKMSQILISPLVLPRPLKIFIVISVDLSSCVLTTWLALYFRLGEFIPLTNNVLVAVALSAILSVCIFSLFGLYKEIFRFSGFKVIVTVSRAALIYGLFYVSVVTAVGIEGVPRTVGIIQPILLLLFVVISRIFAGYWLTTAHQPSRRNHKRALIYGAGAAGRELADALANNPDVKIVGFLDDNPGYHGKLLNGLRIYNPLSLNQLAEQRHVSDVYLALPSISRKRRNRILESVGKAKVSVRTLPSVSDLVHGKVLFSDVRELEIDDLLGREPVKPDKFLMSKNIANKIVMVTGAGGSIGSELCRQIVKLKPKKILLVDQGEFALYTIHQELDELGFSSLLVPLIASVQDKGRLNQIMSRWKPQTVYHAAAYKHVPLVEYNLSEGIKNNVLGTLNMAQCALFFNVEDFVLVSTDKAVRPTNMMGASKRLSEMILQALASKHTQLNFSMVRFGNVLDSSGSVVPKFRQQIKAGGPVTLTHPDISRFFMTITEAAQLVIQAGAMARGGDVFVLDMGEPVKIMGLAQSMIELSGLTLRDNTNPDGDINIEITGLRPGEKLYEELLIGDNAEPTTHSRIMKAHEEFISWAELESVLDKLIKALDNNDLIKIRRLLLKLVPDYEPNTAIVDWLHVEKET